MEIRTHLRHCRCGVICTHLHGMKSRIASRCAAYGRFQEILYSLPEKRASHGNEAIEFASSPPDNLSAAEANVDG